MNAVAEIKDVSGEEVDLMYLYEAISKGDVLHRFSREQVLRLVESCHVPRQVYAHNQYVTGRSEDTYGRPLLNRDKTEVELEAVLPKALEAAGRLYDAYSSLPVGSYYSRSSRPFSEAVTYKEVQMEGSPFEWIARKRFEGFVIGRLSFAHIPYGNSHFEYFPDREVCIPWELDRANPLIHPNASSRFAQNDQIMDEDALKKHIRDNYATWQRLFLKIVPEEIREDMRSLQEEWGFTLRAIEKARGVKFGSWEGFFEYQMRELSEAPTSFDIYRSRARCEELGFVPDTEKVTSLEELTDFVIRFLNLREPGRPFQNE